MRAALVARALRGALPPVDLRAVCFVRAISSGLLPWSPVLAFIEILETSETQNHFFFEKSPANFKYIVERRDRIFKSPAMGFGGMPPKKSAKKSPAKKATAVKKSAPTKKVEAPAADAAPVTKSPAKKAAPKKKSPKKKTAAKKAKK